VIEVDKGEKKRENVLTGIKCQVFIKVVPKKTLKKLFAGFVKASHIVNPFRDQSDKNWFPIKRLPTRL